MSRVWVDGYTEVETKEPLFVQFNSNFHDIWYEVETLHTPNRPDDESRRTVTFFSWNKQGTERKRELEVSGIRKLQYGFKESGTYFTADARIEYKKPVEVQ